MLKKLLCLVFSACLVVAFLPFVPAGAALASDEGSGESELGFLAAFDDGASYKLAVGGVCTVKEGYDLTFSDPAIVSYDESAHTITGTIAGQTTVTYRESKLDDYYLWDDEDWDEEAESGSFTLTVISYADVQGKSYRVAYASATDFFGFDYIDASLRLPLEGVTEDDVYDGLVQLLGDQADVSMSGTGNGSIELSFSAKGTYSVQLEVYGLELDITVKVVELELNRSSLVLYKGKTAKLKVKNAKKARFSSESPLVASVAKSGKVKGGQLGNCKVSIVADGLEFSCSVSVTGKKAYRAVQNALSDLKKKYKYSQAKRMGKGYRDCSSFVSRCYWDGTLGRRIYAIGGSSGKTWALPAAEQASWLNKHGKRIAYKAVSVSGLLPGDTVYYETGYAGTNSRYRHIDHAAIYVGGGLCLNTGGFGGKGTIGYRYYDAGNVKFIGRPISSFMLNKAAIGLAKGKSSKLKALFAEGKVSYKSSKPRVAKVTGNGKVTAKGAGTCTVTAKCKAGTYRCRVVVK